MKYNFKKSLDLVLKLGSDWLYTLNYHTGHGLFYDIMKFDFKRAWATLLNLEWFYILGLDFKNT